MDDFMSIVTLCLLASSTRTIQGLQENTCDALEQLMRSGHRERIGTCIRNSDCTSLVCTAELTQPAPTTVMSVISFDPCSEPVSLYLHVNSTLLKGKPIIDQWIASTTSVKAKPDPLGAFNVTLKHQNGGVLFGVIHQSQFDVIPVVLFPNHFIPLTCTGGKKHKFKVDHEQKTSTLTDNEYNEQTSGLIDNDYEEYYSDYDRSQSEKRKKYQREAITTYAEFDITTTTEDIPSTTESGPSVEYIHKVIMIVVLVGIVLLHVLLAAVNIIACLKF